MSRLLRHRTREAVECEEAFMRRAADKRLPAIDRIFGMSVPILRRARWRPKAQPLEVIAGSNLQNSGPLSVAKSLDHIPNAGFLYGQFKAVQMTIISKIEGTINTAVGKIKQNADGHSFDKDGAEQEALGKSQLEDSPETDKPKKDG